ncbi:hypothetical protein J7643_10035 [bacterium]|nr:hypothetical protein [bacterium]
MDANNFRTLGECEFGTVWFVENEGKVVVNAYQAALYFSLEDFASFAKMITEADKRFQGALKPAPQAPAPAPGGKIRQFRPAQSTPDND